MNLLVLGPPGTFSHEAASLLYPDANISFANNFDALFETISSFDQNKLSSLKAKTSKLTPLIGLVPIENSLHGSVDEILDLLRETKVRLWKVDDIAIHHSFGAKHADAVTKIASHPQALRQCRKWIKEHYPQAEQLPFSSTAAAVEAAASDNSIGAIALKKTIEKHGLPVVHDDIEGADNTTRFGIVALQDPFPDLVRTQMTIMFHPREDYPGLLHRLLTPFKIYDVNLTRIENRPIGSKIGDYFFYVDFMGNRNDTRTQKVLGELRELADVEVLGEW